LQVRVAIGINDSIASTSRRECNTARTRVKVNRCGSGSISESDSLGYGIVANQYAALALQLNGIAGAALDQNTRGRAGGADCDSLGGRGAAIANVYGVGNIVTGNADNVGRAVSQVDRTGARGAGIQV